jgi:hypothetical protein
MGRMGSPEAIANVPCLGRFQFVTGIEPFVDGGRAQI